MSNVENGQLLKASLTFVTHFEKLLNSDLSVSPAETKQKSNGLLLLFLLVCQYCYEITLSSKIGIVMPVK